MIEIRNGKFIRALEWEEVFCLWQTSEGHRENWQKIARERGYASWADWRLSAYAHPLRCQDVKWELHEIEHPAATVAGFYGGPFHSWNENYYHGRETLSFCELAAIQEIMLKKPVAKMAKVFPLDKALICLIKAGRVYVIEGMHRGCALALMHSRKEELDGRLQIAIGRSVLPQWPILGRGTRIKQ